MPNTRLSEKKKIRIRRLNCDEVVVLMWLNTMAAPETWAFKANYGRELKTYNAEGINVTENDIRLQFGGNGQQQTITKEGNDAYLLTADHLDRYDVETLESLLLSPEVFMCVNLENWEIDGPEWLRVNIDTGSWDLGDNQRGNHQLQFHIELPKKKVIWR